MVTLSQNQTKLKAKIDKFERQTNKRFNFIRGFLNEIWERIGCTSSTSTEVFDPVSFQWSSTSGTNDDDNDEDKEESDDESSTRF